MRSLMRFLSGFVLGGMVGASVAILLAPESGTELRNRIQAEVDRIQAEVKKASSDRRAELEQQLAALRKPNKPV